MSDLVKTEYHTADGPITVLPGQPDPFQKESPLKPGTGITSVTHHYPRAIFNWVVAEPKA
jgi:hypothetical protein